MSTIKKNKQTDLIKMNSIEDSAIGSKKTSQDSNIINEEKIEIAKSRDFLFIMDARDCSPNGEREIFSSGPRFDPYSGRALISDLRIKRTVRDYFLDCGDAQTENIMRINKFFIDKNGKFIKPKDQFLQILGLTPKTLRKMKSEDILRTLKDHFIDLRLFGGIFQVHGELIAFTGPVQFEITSSLNYPNRINLALTSTIASESDKGAGSMGSFEILDYAIFCIHGWINSHYAKETGASEKDIKRLFIALWKGTKALITRSKIGQNPRAIISIIYKKPSFKIPQISESIALIQKNVNSFYKSILDVDRFIELLKSNKDKIDYVELLEDPQIKYYVSGSILTSLQNPISEIGLNVFPIDINS